MIWPPAGRPMVRSYISCSIAMATGAYGPTSRPQKHPVGLPFAVHHFHSMTQGWIRLSTGVVLAGGRFVYSQSDAPSNIWMTQIQ